MLTSVVSCTRGISSEFIFNLVNKAIANIRLRPYAQSRVRRSVAVSHTTAPPRLSHCEYTIFCVSSSCKDDVIHKTESIECTATLPKPQTIVSLLCIDINFDFILCSCYFLLSYNWRCFYVYTLYVYMGMRTATYFDFIFCTARLLVPMFYD